MLHDVYNILSTSRVIVVARESKSQVDVIDEIKVVALVVEIVKGIAAGVGYVWVAPETKMKGVPVQRHLDSAGLCMFGRSVLRTMLASLILI